MKTFVVFEVYAVVAWPIWAGGYPEIAQVVSALQRDQQTVRQTLITALSSSGLSGYAISYMSFIPGMYAPIAGLQPRDMMPNSAGIVIRVSAERDVVADSKNLESKVANAFQDFVGALQSYCRNDLPGASRGANLYDVTGRWDAGPGMQLPDGAVSPIVDSLPSSPERRIPIASHNQGRHSVFISYSHRDSRWLTRLQVHLEPLARDLTLQIWDDTRIRPGTDWRKDIDQALKSARVAVLLVTADFMASPFIAQNELPPLLAAAERDGAQILPIIVGPSMFTKHERLSRIQAVNDPELYLMRLSRGKQEKVLNEVALLVRSAFL